MHESVTPKQVALALGASESSIKRWCDQGLLSVVKTPGGHRRIPIQEVMVFLRNKNRRLINPNALGLPVNLSGQPQASAVACQLLKEALLAGDYEVCRRVVFDLFLNNYGLAKICDEVVAQALSEIGDAWCHGRSEIFQERRGCEILQRLLYELKAAMPSPSPETPLACGASVSGDPYRIPTQICELVLQEAGWRAMSFGNDVPISSIIAALEKHQPQLVWLSVSTVNDETRFLEEFQRLLHACQRIPLVVGGRALHESLRRRMEYTVYCDNFSQLRNFSQQLFLRQ